MAFYTIGTDTELFAVSPNGKHISLCGLIGGSKEEPKQILGLPDGFCVQEDNVSVEFNIPPCNTSSTFIACVSTVVNEVSKILEKNNLLISEKASVSFDADQLLHPNALIFGCEPDYDAWKKIENKKPKCDNPNLRTAGGHIHVGTDNDMIECVKRMDLFLGVPSIIIDNSKSSIERRKLYGKAGAMRPKSYGFEYRVLSNFWVFDSEYIKWVFNATKNAVNSKIKISVKDSKEIQRVINEGDIYAATVLAENYGLAIPSGS